MKTLLQRKGEDPAMATSSFAVRAAAPVLGVLAALASGGCRTRAAEPVVVGRFPADDLEGVVDASETSLDAQVSSDGKGSIRIEARQPKTVRLFEVRGFEAEDAKLLYRARLKAANVSGKAYLEMLCHFPDGREFFSRGLEDPLSGTAGWTTREIPFFLEKGERPDLVRLNVVVEGTGTVWVDELQLAVVPR
jgi:hypothetical protein